MKNYIIDFDSTLVRSEGLEELAKIVLRNDEHAVETVRKIAEITKRGMEGKISFRESLQKRIGLLSIHKKHIEELGQILKTHISDSVEKNIAFFRKNRDNIYIISGGFKDFIIPVANYLGISEDHIMANTFIYGNEQVVGFDLKNPLSGARGKVKMLERMKLSGRIIVIGDGWTDYEMKKYGQAEKFIAYCENIRRDLVCRVADEIVFSFEGAENY